MKLKIKGFIDLLTREANLIAGDKNIMMIILIAPVFYAFFYASIYINKSEQNVKLAVVDYNHSALSRELIQKLDSHQLIEVYNVYSNLDEAKQLLYKMDIQGYLVIDSDFEKDIKTGKGQTVSVFLNTSRFLVSNDLNKGINETVLNLNDNIKAKFFKTAGYTTQQAEELKDPIKSEIKTMFNKSETYGDFLLPGLLILIIQQTLLIGLSESVAKERENKTLQTLFTISHKSTNALIFGKTVFYLILYTVYSIFFFVVNFNVFNLTMNGSLILLMFTTILFLFCVSFAGVLIASFFKTKLMALQILAFTTYPVFFLSGYSFPFKSLPESYQIMGQIIPTTPYLEAYRKIIYMGADFNIILPHLMHLLLLTSLFYILARLRMRSIILKHG